MSVHRSSALVRKSLWLILLLSGSAHAATAGKAEQPAAAKPEPSPEEAQVDSAGDAAARAAADAAAREQQAKEMAELHRRLEGMSAELQRDRELQAATDASLASQVEVLSAAARQAPPVPLTARLGLSFTGFLQADWITWNQLSQDQLSPSGAPLNQSQVFIRRARLRAAVDRWWVAGLVEFDGNTVNGVQARLIGAEASLKWPPARGPNPPLVMATIGLFKIPFGFEVGQSDRERLFLERSTTERGLFPGEYDAGVRLTGAWRFTRYSFAAMNGEPIGERTFPLHDPNKAKDFVGRLGVETPVSSRVWVAGGFSGLSGKGFHAGTPATKSVVQWNDVNGNGVFDSGEVTVLPGTAAVPSQSFSRFAYGADFRLGVDSPALGATILYSELYWAKNLDRNVLPADPVALGRDYRELGLYVGLTQDLGPHAIVGVRYDFYNPDADSVNTVLGATTPTALSYQTVAFAGALRSAAGRLIAEFDLNRNHNGRNLQGTPSNLGSNAFLLRGEVSF